MKLIKNNKQMGGLQAFILGVGTATVVLAVILIVLTELQGTQVVPKANCGANSTGGTLNTSQAAYTNCGAAYNATGTVIEKMATIPTWIGIIIVVAMAFIVLGYFYLRGR